MSQDPNSTGLTDRDLLMTLRTEVSMGFAANKEAVDKIERTHTELRAVDSGQEHRIRDLEQKAVAMTSVAEDVRELKPTVRALVNQNAGLEGTKKGAIGAWEIAKQIGLVIAGALALLGVQLAVQPKHQATVERSRVTLEHVQPAAPPQHR